MLADKGFSWPVKGLAPTQSTRQKIFFQSHKNNTVKVLTCHRQVQRRLKIGLDQCCSYKQLFCKFPYLTQSLTCYFRFPLKRITLAVVAYSAISCCRYSETKRLIHWLMRLRTEFTAGTGDVEWTRIARESAADWTTLGTVAARITNAVVVICG